MRVLVAIAVLVGGLLFVSQLPSGVVPWQQGCTVVRADGAVVAEGSPTEISAVVADPGRSLRQALRSGPAVSCRIGSPAPAGDPKEPPLGLTPRAQEVRAEVRAVFGQIPAGGFGPESPLPGRSPRGAHSTGRAIDYFFRPYQQPRQERRGWRLANWAVANAERLGITVVIYRDHIWTARRSAQGWRDYRFRGGDAADPVNRHLDHVHVEVA